MDFFKSFTKGLSRSRPLSCVSRTVLWTVEWSSPSRITNRTQIWNKNIIISAIIWVLFYATTQLLN